MHQYTKFEPHKSLSDFIVCHFVWEGFSEKPVVIESPPSALCSLVFNLSGPYSISNSRYKYQKVPQCFVAGQALKNYTLHVQGSIKIFGVVLRPWGLYNLYNVSMFNLTDERVDFKVLEPIRYKSLLDEVLNADSDTNRVNLVEAYFADVLKTNQYANEHIIIAANTIYEERGRTDLNALIEKMPMSRRTFERKFLHEVGVSPKMYAKIRRFGYTCTLMAGKREVNAMDVLHQGGYYDQSHFIKDFKYFSDRTPRTYAQENTELDNYLDGIAIVEQRLQSEI